MESSGNVGMNTGSGGHSAPTLVYAHSLPDQPQTNWQTLEAHSSEVADMAAAFASGFGSEAWAWIAGQLHDIGKADATFQAYLLRSNGLDDHDYDVAGKGKVNHSSAGAAFLGQKSLGGQAVRHLPPTNHEKKPK